MKKILFIVVSILLFTSCIKKKAIKADPDIVGTWVYVDGSNFVSWIIVRPDGMAIEAIENGIVSEGKAKYSLFESKFYIGKKRFKIVSKISNDTKGVNTIYVKDYYTRIYATKKVDKSMVIKTSESGFAATSISLLFGGGLSADGHDQVYLRIVE